MNYNTKYMDALFLEEFCALSRRKYEENHPVRVGIYDNATVLPFKPSDKNHSKGLGGVIDQNGKYAEISAVYQEDLMPAGYAVPNEDSIQYYDEKAVYLGYFIHQWGHFLVDFLPRLWWLIEHYNDEKILVLVSGSAVRFDGNYLEMLSLFGIKEEKIHYVFEAERYRQITVPELSMQRPDYYSEECRAVYNYIAGKLCKNIHLPHYQRIYWRRTKLKKAKMTEIGEKEIEKLFKRNGYKILSPEKCSLKEQVYYFSTCKEMASLSGTIPHNIVFSDSNTHYTIINKTYRVNTIQLMLNHFSGAKVEYVDAGICMFPASPGSGPFWLEVKPNLLNYAADCGFRIPQKFQRNGAVLNYISGIAKARRMTKYMKMYCRLKNPDLDIGGEIVGKARPEACFEKKHTYFFYRKKLGFMNSDTNFISFITHFYHYFIKGVR